LSLRFSQIRVVSTFSILVFEACSSFLATHPLSHLFPRNARYVIFSWKGLQANRPATAANDQTNGGSVKMRISFWSAPQDVPTSAHGTFNNQKPSDVSKELLKCSYMLASLKNRLCEPELMDDPGINRQSHIQALQGLTRIYHASRTGAAMWRILRREPATGSQPLRVLDIATGGGDMPLDMARRARRAGIPLEIHGCDLSTTAVAYARLRARREGSRARFFKLDISKQQIPSGYDVLTSGLFLHHLQEDAVVAMLRHMSESARQTVIVDDLRRTRFGYLLAWVATRGLSRSAVVHEDGLASVRAAFSTPEIIELAADAGLSDATVIKHWPQRHMLIWRRNQST